MSSRFNWGIVPFVSFRSDVQLVQKRVGIDDLTATIDLVQVLFGPIIVFRCMKRLIQGQRGMLLRYELLHEHTGLGGWVFRRK